MSGEPAWASKHVVLHHGDSREVLKALEPESLDALVSDPPYELGFMGKQWDASGVAYDVDLWRAAFRALKPGGHVLAFGGTRTYHRMAVAIEDAGFEIRDSIHWVYGSGFPKSHDVSKAIDKMLGVEREVVTDGHLSAGSESCKYLKAGVPCEGHGDERAQNGMTIHAQQTAPGSEEAARWTGWGTALKPSHEPIVVARKPMAGTVAQNVLEHGTGALNIEGCRVGAEDGRWPSNFLLDAEAAEVMDGQSGISKSTKAEMLLPKQPGFAGDVYGGDGNTDTATVRGHDDEGGASRFFPQFNLNEDDLTSFRYVAKPDRTERDVGLADLPKQQGGSYEGRLDGSLGAITKPSANIHPTVKPLDLMRWLIRLVTPPGGTVLEPFSGSGTTLVAAVLEDRNAVGIELTDDYLPIIQGRVEWAEREIRFGPVTGPTKVRKEAPGTMSLFD